MSGHQQHAGLGGHPHEAPADSPFVARFDPPLRGPSGGVLSGLRFGAQDLFEIEGRTSGFGHPDWLSTHEPSDVTAPAVSRCLDAGAELVGMTVSDKLAFSINGTHAFFDTPPNPRKPGHGPGGSSGGSASAVALGLVDFALGPDVRAPSSYCGVFGFRTSTGIVDPAGMLPLAPSFDAAGWFAADAAMLARVGEAMLPAPTAAPAPVSTAAPRLEHLIVATDALEAVQPGVAAALEEQLPALAQRFGTVERIRLAEEGLEEWAARFAVIQAAEAWRFNGAWIQEHGARLSPDVRARFERGIAVTDAEESSAREAMARIAARLDGLLGDDGVLLIPTAPFPPPPLGVPSAELEPYRPRMLQLTSISGLGGIPQLCLPLLTVDGPVGVSLLARRGSDAALLELGVRVCPAS